MTPEEWAETGEDPDESWDSADSAAYQDGLERGEADAAEGLPFDDSGLSGAAWSGYWDGYNAKSAAREGGPPIVAEPIEVIAAAYRNAALTALTEPSALAAVVLGALDGAGYSVIPTAELERFQEIEAEASGRFRVKEIIKVSRDEDLYVGWSHTCEMPAWAGTRAQAIEAGCPPSRLRRADETGSSMKDDFGCTWDDTGLIAEQRGYLPRARIGEYAILWLLGRTDEAFGLLEPFEGETEVRRG